MCVSVSVLCVCVRVSVSVSVSVSGLAKDGKSSRTLSVLFANLCIGRLNYIHRYLKAESGCGGEMKARARTLLYCRIWANAKNHARSIYS